MLRYIFDSLYNTGVEHSLSVYTLKNLCGGILTASFRQVCVKMALRPFISVYILLTIRLRIYDLVMLNLNLFGQSKLNR